MYAQEVRFPMSSKGLVYHKNASHPGKKYGAISPNLANYTSKVAAENELSISSPNYRILSLKFDYGYGAELLASLPKVVATLKWHLAQSFSLVHQ